MYNDYISIVYLCYAMTIKQAKLDFDLNLWYKSHGKKPISVVYLCYAMTIKRAKLDFDLNLWYL
jgi:hypothetical protein